MDSNFWSESINDYNDLCYTCLEAIGYDQSTDSYSIHEETNLLLEEADKLLVGEPPDDDREEEV